MKELKLEGYIWKVLCDCVSNFKVETKLAINYIYFDEDGKTIVSIDGHRMFIYVTNGFSPALKKTYTQTTKIKRGEHVILKPTRKVIEMHFYKKDKFIRIEQTDIMSDKKYPNWRLLASSPKIIMDDTFDGRVKFNFDLLPKNWIGTFNIKSSFTVIRITNMICIVDYEHKKIPEASMILMPMNLDK